MTDPLNPTLLANTTYAAHDASREPELNKAAMRVAADVEAVSEDDLETVNRDEDFVVTTVLGAMRHVEPHLDALSKLPGLDMTRIRKLADYADALLYWNASSTYAPTMKPEVIAMIDEAIILRERTLHDLSSLVQHGVLPGSLLEGFGGTAAYRKVARDVIGLSNLVHERWADIQGKSMISLEKMDQASTLGRTIMQAIGDREGAKASVARDVMPKNKAYTLVVRTYGELRLALAYLRRVEGDADKIAPSLFALRHGRKKADANDASEASTPNKPTTSAPVPKQSSLIEPDDADANAPG